MRREFVYTPRLEVAMKGSMAVRSSQARMRIRRRRVRVRRLTHFSVNRMVPNVLTLLALCAGMTAIRFAVNEDFQYAVFAIIAAGIFDGLDGRLARLLKATSRFGAELDSLSDFVSFGVAPAAVLYLWTMAGLHSIGWAIVLFFTVCCALRLARFNTQLAAEPPPYAANFFSGAPAPAGAGLVMLPMFISFEWGGGWADWIARSPYLNAVWISGVALMMVSSIPTVSLKRIRIPHHFVIPTLLAIGVMAGFFTTAPWPTLSFVGAVYLASIPLTVRAAHRQRRVFEARQNEPAAVPAPLPAAASLPLGEAAPPASEWRH
jgi:CDP-diacylglycerol--serine O-phosphatidyltransferase